MRTRFYTFIVLSLFAASCSKDSPINLPPDLQNKTVQPLKYIVDSKTVVDSMLNFYGGIHELGIRFKSSSDGIIKELGLNGPVEGVFPVSVWDMETQNRLASVSIKTKANEFVYEPISQLKIEAGKEYVISFHNNKDDVGQRYFLGSHKSGRKIYPFTSYGIQFLDFRYRSGNESKFPIGVAELEQDNLPGILDFKIELGSSSD